MRITILLENDGLSRYETEHGLAVHINYNDKNYLLDTGASDAFSHNADQLGIDLGEVDTAVLSHAHYDHSGGYESFFQCNKKANVYLREEAKQPYYGKIAFVKRYVGIPKGLLNTYAHRFVFVQSDYQLDKGVWLIEHKTAGLESRGKRGKMYQVKSGKLVPDSFVHEQSLVFENEKGLIIFNSCSHAGIENIVSEVKDTFCGADIYAVFGGFHLMGLRGVKSLGVPQTEVRQLAETLKEQDVKNIYTGHCTGTPAYEIMSLVLGERLHHMPTATVIEI